MQTYEKGENSIDFDNEVEGKEEDKAVDEISWVRRQSRAKKEMLKYLTYSFVRSFGK